VSQHASPAGAEAAAGPDQALSSSLPAHLRPAEVLRGFSRIWRTAALYGRAHPVVARFADDLQHLLSSLLTHRPAIGIFLHEETFFVDNTILLEESLQLSLLLSELKKRNILSIEIRRGIEPYELRSFVDILTMPAAAVEQGGGAAAYLEAHSVHHIAVGNAQLNPVLPQAGGRVDPGNVYRAGLHVVDELYAQASSNAPLNLHHARVVVNTLADILTKDRLSLMRAVTIKNYDAGTAHHSVNVGILSLFMASRLAFDEPLTSLLGLAALLHDIGKVRIPLAILNKAGPLTEEERKVMQQHPVYGAQMLRDLAGPSRVVMLVAFEHHANYDLSGYPRITSKARPHFLARLVQIVDVFDAATTQRRLYRHAQPPDEAMQFILARAGSTYDPALARMFLHEVGVYPVGTLLQLDGGELAVVSQPARGDPARPLVKVIDPRPEPPEFLYDLNLEEHPDRAVVRSVNPAEVGVDVAALQFPPEDDPASRP